MDEQVKTILDAVGDYVDEQVAEIFAGLKDLRSQLGLPREEFEKTRSDLLVRIDDLNHRYEILRSTVPADRGEEIAELRGRLLQLERTPGPPGKDGKDGASPDVEDVVNVLVLRHADRLRGEQGPVGAQGPVGGTGAPGKDADPNVVADSLFERHSAELRGEPGQSVSRDEVVAKLKQDKEFLKVIRGDKGEPGQSVSRDEVAAELKQDQQFLEIVRGEKGDPGQSVSRDEVVAELKQDQQFLDTVRGERGPAGERGSAGPLPDVAALIEASMAEFRQREMSEIKAVFARYA